MTLASALALLLATASPDLLDEARSAFAAADYVRAERLALAAAEEQPAPGFYLAGLARFRDGRPADALDALDRAEGGADSPAAWHFNRGACLYELGRNTEAEAEFLAAESDPDLAAVALINAGFAALDAGDPAGATALAERARRVATGASEALLGDLDEALAADVDLKAEPAADPPSEPSAPARPWTLEGRVEGGWDSDALRAGTGALERPGAVTSVASPFAAAAAAFAGRFSLLGATAEASYGLAQIAYLRPVAEDRSVQQHDLVLALRGAPLPSLRLELAMLGQYALAGLSSMRGLQAAAGARLAASLEHGDGHTTRAEISFTLKDGIGSEFAALDGDRLEAAASHEVSWASLTLRGGYRLLLERIGTVFTRRPDVPAGNLGCPMGCSVVDVESLAYLGQVGWLAARLQPWPWLRLDASGGIEWRHGLHDLHTVFARPDGSRVAAGRLQRDDMRFFTSEAAALRLTPWLSLTLRHEWLASRTDTNAASGSRCDAFGQACLRPAGTGWDKHVLSLGAAAAW